MATKAWVWALGAGAALVALGATSKTSTYTYGGPDLRGISRDPKLLLRPFAAWLEMLFQRMRARGLDPLLHEGYRTAERAKQLAAQGPGILNSLHIYGAAADIISASKGWSSPAFYSALGEEAQRLGLVWGGTFGNVDMPHVQAVLIKDQDAFRSVYSESGRIAYIEKRMQGYGVTGSW